MVKTYIIAQYPSDKFDGRPTRKSGSRDTWLYSSQNTLLYKIVFNTVLARQYSMVTSTIPKDIVDSLEKIIESIYTIPTDLVYINKGVDRVYRDPLW